MNIVHSNFSKFQCYFCHISVRHIQGLPYCVYVYRDDDDINDVASMAGVNLSEESANILATNSGLVGALTHSCKDEAFLSCPMLQRRMLEIGETLTTLLTIKHPSTHLVKPVSCCSISRQEVWGDRPGCRGGELCLPRHSATAHEPAGKRFPCGPAQKCQFQGHQSIIIDSYQYHFSSNNSSRKLLIISVLTL